MKAVVYNKKGVPDKLVYCDVEKPKPKDNEVLVQIVAVSVNAMDYRSMKMGMIPKLRIFGADIAGRVESVGNNTAALPVAATTALRALRDKGNIQQGQKVLIVGSSGGVGTFAVQLAKYYGAIITAVCSSRNVEQSLSFGADKVIDYTKEDFPKSGDTYDLILAINGNCRLSAYKRMLNPGGIYVMVGGALSQIFRSIVFGRFMSFGSTKLAGDGKIKPLIESTYSLDKSAEAMRYLNEGHAQGKVVIKCEITN